MSVPARVAVIAGDGIGVEVVPPALDLMDAALADCGGSIDWHPLDWSADRYLATGEYLPPHGLDLLRTHDAIFLGAVGDPRVPDAVSLGELLLPIRRTFDQYVNYRPLMRFDGVPTPLRTAEPFDVVIVRENTEGEYADAGGRVHVGSVDEVVLQTSVFTRRGVERVLRYGFELAATRRGVLTSATKSNALRHSMVFWDEVADRLAEEYPGVEYRHVHVDALVAALVRDPASFDVVVCSNLFGDILADLGAALMGSIGLAPSANLNPAGTSPSLFEPVHGSAPDIAGRGIANPVGQLLSGALLLRHLGHVEAGDRIERAVRSALRSGAARTPDLGGTATTVAAARAIGAELATSSE